jgi:hypothetical protein
MTLSSARGDLHLRGPLLAEACEALGADFSTDEQYLAAWFSFSERVGSPCPDGPLPDFLTICPAKTGTTWLAHHLGRHPDIYVPPEKELHYFNRRWRVESVDQYQKHFIEAGSQLKGEMTPPYALLPSVAIRDIQRLNPRLKLIFLARRLPERAWSQTRHCFRHYELTFRNRIAPLSEFPAAALAVDFLSDYALTSADYEGILRRWMQFFPAEQFHVRYLEEATAHPEEYLRDVLGFLGAQEELPEGDLGTRINEGVKAALPAWAGRFLESLFARRQREIEAFLHRTFGLKPLWRPPESAALEPLLLEDRSGGWRVHLHEGAFEAIRLQSGDRIHSPFLGGIRLRIEEQDGMPSAAAFPNDDQLLMRVLAELDRDLETASVRLLGSFQGFSVVHWKRWFFGIRQSLGPVDVTLGEDILRGRYSTDDFLVASSEREVEARIEAMESRNVS